MKFLLTAVNAKYIHSNLGIYSLKAYAHAFISQKAEEEPQHSEAYKRIRIELAEYTINQQPDEILQDIYRQKPQVIGFSCYIWNIWHIRQILREIPKILPGTDIWLGGPEAFCNARRLLEEEPSVTGIMAGEGEGILADLAVYYGTNEIIPEEGLKDGYLRQIPGILFRDRQEQMVKTGDRPLLDLDTIPFPYTDLDGMEHRILYYESSRGCPYRCSYCLSSIDRTVRFRSLELVKRELDFFLNHKVPQVKFVDRTFNCKRSHALAVWKYLLEHDNGITNFHFEIAGDGIGQEELAVFGKMRKGLIQLETGVQSTNPQTIEEIRREMDLHRLGKAVAAINSCQNIHQHLDLIAGLPFEGLESFKKSFDDVYAMRPEQLQLGFLKVLSGSYMAEMAGEYGILYHETPPYEVLSTKWLTYEEILQLKAVEEMTEVYYNSRQFTQTLKEMEKHWESSYAMFEEMAWYYETRKLFGIRHSRLARYEILYDFLRQQGGDMEQYRDLLVCDLYLRENLKSRPSFARDLTPWKERIRLFFREEEKQPRYLKGYEGYDARQMGSMAHVEVMGDGSMILFDYKNRDALTYNAKAVKIDDQSSGRLCGG